MYRGIGEVPVLDLATGAPDPSVRNARALQIGGVVDEVGRRTAPTRAELAKKRVAELKELCIARGLEPKGVKKGLIELIIRSYARGSSSRGKKSSKRGASSSSSSSSQSAKDTATSSGPVVRATYYPVKQRLTLEWLSSPKADMIADSVVAIAMQIEANPARLHDRMVLPTWTPRHEESSSASSDAKNDDKLQVVIHSLLCARFGDDSVVWTPPSTEDTGLFYLTTEGSDGAAEGTVTFPALDVNSEDNELKVALEAILQDMVHATRPYALI
jgi:hypothetical protein